MRRTNYGRIRKEVQNLIIKNKTKLLIIFIYCCRYEKYMEQYYKDPDLKGIYVKRCKCGARPYIDRIAIVPTPWWIKCNCGRTGVSDTNKQTAIDNWNNDKLEW